MTPASLHPGSASSVARAADDAASGVPGFGVDVAATLAWCREVGATAVLGEVSHDVQWEVLATTAARDVTAARMLEPHLDALNILAEAEAEAETEPRPSPLDRIGVSAESTWGVFAAEGAGVRVDAREVDGEWMLSGTKPWCSLAANLTHALVTAHVEGGRRLFAVALRSPGVKPHDGPWHARGLADVVSAPVDFDDASAVPVGATGWYLRRPGFAAGGIGVAACWWGAATGLMPALTRAAARDGADQLSRMHLGRADAALWAARAALSEAAATATAGQTTGLLAARVRTIVADAAELVLREADHALGPLPLVADDAHARRVADLHLYLRQHHGERDSARIGRELSETPT
ncbi:hypothetical protein QL996_05295 [Planococcus sp. APC 4015]|nr:hypothetical protein [Planococcus sp. APC 4015]